MFAEMMDYRPTPYTSMPDFKHLLETTRTIAVIGCSDNPWRTSYDIARYMQEAGYRIIPINPNIQEVLGEPAYPDLAHVPLDVQIDLVNIFRQPQHTAEMVEQVLARIATSGERPVIWTQLGVSSPKAEQLAADAGLPYVHERCIAVEHRRAFS